MVKKKGGTRVGGSEVWRFGPAARCERGLRRSFATKVKLFGRSVLTKGGLPATFRFRDEGRLLKQRQKRNFAGSEKKRLTPEAKGSINTPRADRKGPAGPEGPVVH